MHSNLIQILYIDLTIYFFYISKCENVFFLVREVMSYYNFVRTIQICDAFRRNIGCSHVHCFHTAWNFSLTGKFKCYCCVHLIYSNRKNNVGMYIAVPVFCSVIGFCCLAGPFYSSHTVGYMYLSLFFRFGDSGCSGLCRGLHGNRTLLRLSLSYCDLGSPSGEILGKTISNTAIR